MEVLSLDQEWDNIMFKLTPEIKALLSAVHNTHRVDGKANESLVEFIHEAIEGRKIDDNKHGWHLTAFFPEVKEGKGELVAGLSLNSNGPDKFRDVKISLADRQYVSEVSRHLKGNWVLFKGGRKVRTFSFSDDYRSKGVWLSGTVLWQLISTRFKAYDEKVSLELKARGAHIKTGDWVSLVYYIFIFKDDPTSGIAMERELILNFTHNCVAGGKTESYELSEDKEATKEEVQDKGEDFEIDDYDDYER